MRRSIAICLTALIALASPWVAGCGESDEVEGPKIDSPNEPRPHDELCEDEATCRERAEAFEPSRELLGFDCQPTAGEDGEYGTQYTFGFEIGQDIDSFLMVPLVADGVLVPRRLEAPSHTVDLVDDYRHHNAQLLELDSFDRSAGVGTFGQVNLAWPVLVPYAPRFTDYLEPGGRYELVVEADEDTPCLYMLEGRGGVRLDVNVYLVGADGRTASSADSDADLQEIFAHVDQLYEAAGVELGQVRYVDVPEQVKNSYRVVRSQHDVYRLTAYGSPPDDTLDGHLSVDLFLVDDITFAGGNVLGISAGVPGAAALHGNPRNGLVFQATDIGHDNAHVGHLVAHEIGHFIGLRHTTEVVKDTGTNIERMIEQSMGVIDPIEDTPVCDNIQQKGFDCPDADNLMFPAAPPSSMGITPRLTPGQSAVFQASPLVKQ